MTRLSTIAVALVLAGAASALANNLLQNPGFESPAGEGLTADFWTRDGFVTPPDPPESTSMFQPWANHTGERGYWMKSFLGNAQWITDPNGNHPPPANANLWQDVPGTPGESYDLSAWFRYEKYYSGLNPLESTQTLLAMDFLDAGMAVLDSSVLDVDTVMPTLPDGTADGNWYQFSVSGVAPAGTAYVRARTTMVDGMFAYYLDGNGNWVALNPQSAFADDFVLTPEPASLVALLLLAALRRR